CLSGGRFILGAGTGYIEPEFRTLGIPFADRGDRMDEYIRVLHQVWSTDGAQSFHGRFVQFDGMHVEPRPVQRPWPPIWVAGNGPRVLRRAVELAEGWHPLEPPLAELEAGIARMEALCVKTGRQRRPYVSICFRRLCFGPTAHMAGTGADRRMLNGSTMDVLHDLRELRKRGVGHLVVRFMPGDRGWRDVEEAMRLFANVRGEVGD
ncbi:MAG: LLM class flavin-dependent oxidoreductase, partial [Chloroflexi bacterium]|nr:LLM class flavin-dependent oxidoreductase [Chloroflexota bacterium]